MATRQKYFERILLQHNFVSDERVLREELKKENSDHFYCLPSYWADFEKLANIDLSLQVQAKEKEAINLYLTQFKRGTERENQLFNQMHTR